MKLHYLKMQAFGPFAGEECIDFSKFDGQLFLIDGLTGAGKSSILHAICYALYGKTTDSDRKDLGLRSDHAEDGCLTELYLEFSLRDQHYRITRTPNQIRPAVYGGKMIDHKASAHFRRVLDDGSEETLVAKRKKEADEQIKAIIGLTVEQFRQVMILPQGKFRELLLANSADRQEILSTLFQTEIYKCIEDLLKSRAGGIEKQYDEIETRKTNILSDLALTESDALVQQLSDMTRQLDLQQQIKQQASDKKEALLMQLQSAEALEALFISQHQYNEQYQLQLTQADHIKGLQQQLSLHDEALKCGLVWEKLTGEQAQYQLQKNELAQLLGEKLAVEKEVKQAQQYLNNAEQNYQQRDTLKAELISLQQYQEQLNDYATLVFSADKADKSHQNKLAQHHAIQDKIARLQDTINQENLEIKAIENQLVDKESSIVKQQQAEMLCRTTESLQEAKDLLDQYQLNHDKGLAKKQGYENDYQQLLTQITHLEQQYLKNQAAALAVELVKGEACLVCGSSEYPKPAILTADNFTEHQDNFLTESHEKSVELLNFIRSLEQKLARSEQTLDDKQLEVNQLKQQLGAAVNDSPEILRDKYQQETNKLATLIKVEQDLVALKESKQLKINQQNDLQGQIKLDEQVLSDLLTQKIEFTTQLENVQLALPDQYRDERVLQQTIAQVQKNISQLEAEYQHAQSEKNQADQILSAYLARLTLTEQKFVILEQNYQKQEQLWLDTLTQSCFISVDDFLKAKLSPMQYQDTVDIIQQYTKKLDALSAKLALLADQLHAKEPPDIEHLQQQIILQTDVLAKAETDWLNTKQHYHRLYEANIQLEKLVAQQAEVKQQYELVGMLSKAASGAGQVKVSLERFVLSNLLSLVLNIASKL